MRFTLTRRGFVMASLGASVLGATRAAALSDASARALVEKVVADLQKTITSGKSDKAVVRDLERLFVRYADVNIMALYALGNDGRSASNSQKRAFTDAFTGYISRKYGKRFREFIGGRVEIKSSRAIKQGYEVKTLAYLRGQSPFDVTFLVSDRSGRDKFYNFYIEGVNLLLTERTEIGAMLDRRGGNINSVINDLKTAG